MGDYNLANLIPRQPKKTPGKCNFDQELRKILNKAIKNSPKTRNEIAEQMKILTGDNITKFSIDSWTAKSRNKWRFPLQYVVAFEIACETHDITAWLAQKRGCKLLIGEDALLAELGKIESMEQELRARKKAIKQHLKKGL